MGVEGALGCVVSEPFELRISGAGHFGTTQGGATLWAGVKESDEPIRLQSEIEAAFCRLSSFIINTLKEPLNKCKYLNGPGKMRAHYLQHVPFESLGSIEGWLRDAGYEITATHLYQSQNLPEIEDVDFLVIMGGPMSVNDLRDHPWLADEKAFIKRAVAAGKPTLGICLGAQLIASAMGGKVVQNPAKEIGWFPIRPIAPPPNKAFRFAEETAVFHWHGETFSLPPGAIRIAESNGCENQAFQIANHVIGLQFHLETTPVSAQAIVENCREELVPGEYIQAEADILSAPNQRYEAINRLMGDVLAYLHSQK